MEIIVFLNVNLPKHKFIELEECNYFLFFR